VISMNEADLRSEINAAIQRLHYWTATGRDLTVCPQCGFEIYPRGGRPDTFFWWWDGPFGAVEYKCFPRPTHGSWARTSFSLKKITPEQRTWFAMAQGDFPTAPYRLHLYIGLGTVHGTAGAKENARLAWVVPWSFWVRVVERLLIPVQISLPLAPRKRLRKAIQEQELWATSLLRQYELHWQKGGWEFPEDHPLVLAAPARNILGPRDLVAFREKWRDTKTTIKEEMRAWTQKRG